MSEIGEDLSELWLTEVLINARQDVCLGMSRTATHALLVAHAPVARLGVHA